MRVLKGVIPMSGTSFSAKLPPPKPTNADRRAREYLTSAEVDQLMKAARRVGRYGHRDAALLPDYPDSDSRSTPLTHVQD